MLAPAGKRFTGIDQREPLRSALQRYGELSQHQTAGRLLPMVCVSLEVTQRCNLDCTLCYLSDRAEMAKDVPLEILFERIDMIESHYGKGTSIQISGGDPTLRKAEDLEALCRYIRTREMRSCLMTNGIKAPRSLLKRLAQAGLDDVAFHVDLTQQREGYPTEESLNTLRDEYIARARGLGVRTLFNTTVFDGNVSQLRKLAAFFRKRSADIDFISFQMQADAGRGVLRERDSAVTHAAVVENLSAGFGLPLDFDAVTVGHPHCNRYTTLLCAGGDIVPMLTNAPLIEDTIAALEASDARAKGYLDASAQLFKLTVRHPSLALRLIVEAIGWLWRLRRGLCRARGRARRMSVLIHNFMDASNLDRARCETCVFMVATEHGPLSMCVHNAQRDTHIFSPAAIDTAEGRRFWHAQTGEISASSAPPDLAHADLLPFKRQKGRVRARTAATRKRGT